jgi:hypothetical protein
MSLRRSLLAAVLLLSASYSHAEMLVGYAFVNGISGLNLEWATKRNSYYVVPGTYLVDGGLSDDWRWVAGFRHRIDRGFTNISGYYTGVIVGDLGGESAYERLGVGFEIGHQWVTEYLRTTVGAGVAVLEEKECSDYRTDAFCSSETRREQAKLDVEPGLILTLTISLRR